MSSFRHPTGLLRREDRCDDEIHEVMTKNALSYMTFLLRNCVDVWSKDVYRALRLAKYGQKVHVQAAKQGERVPGLAVSGLSCNNSNSNAPSRTGEKWPLAACTLISSSAMPSNTFFAAEKFSS